MKCLISVNVDNTVRCGCVKFVFTVGFGSVLFFKTGSVSCPRIPEETTLKLNER